MHLRHTILQTLLLFAVITCKAGGGPSTVKQKERSEVSTKASHKNAGVNYTFHLDNTVNKNDAIDSVFVILDKYDLSGAGFVKKIFYPDADNQIVIEDLPVGKYYAEVYVLGAYRKHFSSVIRTVKVNRKNKVKLQLDYKDTYTPGNVSIPGENPRLFAYNKK